MNKQKEIDRRLKLLDEAEERAREYQETELASDYDEALKEYNKTKKQLYVKFQGKRYRIPSTIPFSLSVFIMRECIQKKKMPDGSMKEIFVFPDDKIFDFIERVFGKEFAIAVMNSDIDSQFIADVIVPDILAKWGLVLQTTAQKKTGTTDSTAD
jgi:hypothetical protein